MKKFENNQPVLFEINDESYGQGKIVGFAADLPIAKMWIIEVNKQRSSLLLNEMKYNCIVCPESLISTITK